jgi:hypothetical protein
MYFAAKLTKGDIDFYLALGGNASYFKSDGQNGCSHIFLHNKKTGTCFLERCLCSYYSKDMAEHARRLKKHIIEYDENNFEKHLEENLRMHPWQVSLTLPDGKIFPGDEFKKLREPKPIKHEIISTIDIAGKEDGGQALICESIAVKTQHSDDDENGMVVVIQSWDVKSEHTDLNALIGKKVKITIEEIK